MTLCHGALQDEIRGISANVGLGDGPFWVRRQAQAALLLSAPKQMSSHLSSNRCQLTVQVKQDLELPLVAEA